MFRCVNESYAMITTTELTFTEAAFVAYLNLIHLCFGDIHPVGTVVELDESRLSAEIAAGFVSDDEVRYVVLTGRKVSLPGAYTDYVVDYIGRMWPEGEGSKVAPLLISNLMIKRIIHQGLVLDDKEATDLTLREQLVTGMRQSLAFASEEKQVQIMKDLNLPTAGTTDTSNEKEVS